MRGLWRLVRCAKASQFFPLPASTALNHQFGGDHWQSFHSAGIVACAGLGAAALLPQGALAEEDVAAKKDYALKDGKRPTPGEGSLTAQWRVYTDMAKDLAEKGRLKEAEGYFRLAVECARQGFGLLDPHVAAACNNLAEVYRVGGNYTDAVALYEQALHILQISYGDQDLRTSVAVRNLGGVYYQMENFKKASEYYSQALQAHIKYLGRTHTETLISRLSLARSKAGEGHKRQARKLVEESANVLEEKGINAYNLRLLSEFIHVMFKTGGSKEANRLLAFAVQTIRTSNETQQFALSKACCRLSEALLESMEHRWARDICEECQKAHKNVLGEKALLAATQLRMQAIVEMKDPKGSKDAALEYGKEASEICREAMDSVTESSGWFGLFGAARPANEILEVAVEFLKTHSYVTRILMEMGKREDALSVHRWTGRILDRGGHVDASLKELEESRHQFGWVLREWKSACDERDKLGEELGEK